jgi:hypothetical protein
MREQQKEQYLKKKKNIYGEKVGPSIVQENKMSLDNMELDRRDNHDNYDPFYKVNVSRTPFG